MKTKSIIVDIVCFLFILLFVYTAITKLMDPQKFEVRMGQSPLIENYAGFLAYAVPITELTIAVMLAVPLLRMVGLYASFTIMVMFAAYVIAVLQLDSNIPCSCGGVIEAMGWNEHLIFNSVFVILGLVGILFQNSLQDRNKTGPNNRSDEEQLSSHKLKEALSEAL